jgi:hypothetical protein
MMTYNRLLALLIFFLGIVDPLNSYAQTSLPDAQQITVWGEASITQDPAYDKKMAIAHARRIALEKVVGTYVTSTTHVRNFQVVEDRIYSKATGFINNINILQEQRKQLQRVQIEANVGLVPVTEILRASGLLRKWRVGVILYPHPQQLSIMLTYYSRPGIMEVAGNIEASVGQRLVQAGFKVVDPRHLQKLRDQLKRSDTLPDATFSGIDLVVSGTFSLSGRSSSGAMRQSICQVHSKVIRMDTGEIVYQGNIGNTFDGTTLLVNRDLAMKYATSMGNGLLADGTPDLRTFGVGNAAAMDKAIQLSSAMLADEMVSQISRIPAAASATVALEVYGLDFTQLLDFEEHLSGMQGVSNVTAEEFADGRQNLEVAFDGDAMMLARALSRSAFFRDMKLQVMNVSKNRIVLKKK